MKKLFALLFIAVLTFALAACNGEEDYNGYFDPEAPATLRIWLDSDAWADAVIAAFEARYPNVTVEYMHMGNTDARDRVTLDAPAGIGPDVFLIPHDGIQWLVLDGIVEAIPRDLQEMYRRTLVSTAVDTVSLDGNMYAVPISMENPALFFNKDLWGPEPPATFEEILEFSLEWNDPANNQWTMAWQLPDPYHNIHWLHAFGVRIFGPDHDDFRQPGWETPEAAEGLYHFRMMRQLFDVPTAEAGWDQTVARFQRGELPFTISGPWAISDALANNTNFGVSRLPTIAGNQPWTFSGLILACVNSFSENQYWANRFVQFLVSEEGASIMYNYAGRMTTLLDISNIPGLADDPHLSGIAEQAPYTIPMPIIPAVHQMWGALDPLFEFVWNGELSIEEAQEVSMQTFITLLAGAGIEW